MMAIRRSALGLSLAVAIAGGPLVPGTGTAAAPDTAAITAQKKSRVRKKAVASWVHHWNTLAIDTSGLDHTPVSAGETRVYGEQLGPGRASRAMAIVHVAIFETLNAIDREYASLAGLRPIHGPASVKAAIAQASRDTLVALFPSQTPRIDALLAEDLDQLPEGRAKRRGIALGQRAAAAALTLGAGDGSQYVEPRMGEGYATSDLPGHWRQDPISRGPVARAGPWPSSTWRSSRR